MASTRLGFGSGCSAIYLSSAGRSTVVVFHAAHPGLLLPIGILYGAAVIGAAYLAYRLVEVPGRSLFGSIAKRTRRKPKRALAETIIASRA